MVTAKRLGIAEQFVLRSADPRDRPREYAVKQGLARVVDIIGVAGGMVRPLKWMDAVAMRRIPLATPSRPVTRTLGQRIFRRSTMTFRLTNAARQIIALARKAEAEGRTTANSMHAYQLRRRLDARLSAVGNQISDKPLTSRDDLLTLALAGLYASDARHALVKVILRAGSINRKATPYTLRTKR